MSKNPDETDLEKKLKAAEEAQEALKKQVEDAEAKTSELQKSLEEKEAELKKKLEKANETTPPELEAIQKEQAELKKKLDDSEKQNIELQKQVAAEKDLRLTKEFIQKAQTEFSNIPGKSEELGTLLKSASTKLTEDEFKTFEATLKAADEAISKGALFAEAGVSLDNPAGATSRIEKAAEKEMEIDSELTKEQAIVKAIEKHPELYAEHLKKSRGGAK